MVLNCEGVLGYYPLNRKRSCWEAYKVVPKQKDVRYRIKEVQHLHMHSPLQ